MVLSPQALTAKENTLFDASARKAEVRGRLYRDGVPTTEAYLAQRVRALFVFREPNMRGNPYTLDMRDEVRDEPFRPVGRDGTRQPRSPTCWWNATAGMFAHAVAAALDCESAVKAYDQFGERDWDHDVVNRFAYIQIKQVGGGGTWNALEIRAHAAKYAEMLKQQYEPSGALL